MPTLDDKNVKSVIKDIPKKGFTAKFWQDHRAAICQGSGVAKAMNRLKSYKIPPSGDPSNASMMEMSFIQEAFTDLQKALNKAKTKCSGLQKHTKKMIDAYISEVDRILDTIATMVQNQDKEEEQREKLKKDEEKAFEKVRKEQEKNQMLVLKELEEIDKRARNMGKACDIMVNELAQATADIKKLTTALQTQTKANEKLAPELLKRFEDGLVALQKKHNVPLHAQNLKNSLPKLFKDLTTNFKQYFKLDYAKKERMSTGAALKSAQDQMTKAQRSFKTYAEFHQAIAAEINSAK